MSQRTILEFNHDLAHRIEKDPAGFAMAILQVLRVGVNKSPNNAAGDQIEGELKSFGVTASPTHHHSDKAQLTLSTESGQEYWRQEF